MNVRAVLIAAAILTLASAGAIRWGSTILNQSASAQATTVAVFNAASFANDANKALTPDSIAAVFGAFITQNNQSYNGQTVPLPTTLGGVRVTINNVAAGLFFVGPTQINLLIPSNAPDGDVNIVVTNSDNSTRTGTFKIVRGAPGIFTARSNGQGVAAAYTSVSGLLFNPDNSERDMSAGTTAAPNVLVLFGTGIRNTPAANPNDGNGVAESVTVKIQGVPATVEFAGKQSQFEGLDQLNVVIPPELAGLGSLKIVVTANGRDSNESTIKIGGQLPPVKVTDVTIGQSIDGQLTANDQVQLGNDGKTYFFDAYRFAVTTPNTMLAVDQRSTQFDSGVLLYKLDGTTLTLVGADDQTGGYGNGNTVNNNALLITLIKTPGTYIAFASSSDFAANALGTYTLKISTVTTQQLTYGQTVNNGNIQAGDLQTSAGDYLDVYWFDGLNNDNVRANMNSTAFDAFLILQRNDGDPPLAFDDSAGGGTNAQVTFRLTSNGTYLILATPFAPNITGAYTLSLNKVAALAAQASWMESLWWGYPGRELKDGRTETRFPAESSFTRFGRRRIVVDPQQ
ncbi:MAG: hypothetical protein IPO77_12170 [Acidobacteria bacterium]|nr:hypothetical protein [Acidobacteriota bacterium]